jgi:hypothetical protein
MLMSSPGDVPKQFLRFLRNYIESLQERSNDNVQTIETFAS